jgi:CheY-like chemotaxis protein
MLLPAGRRPEQGVMSSKSPRAELRGRKVMVVDDESVVRTLSQRLLERVGYEVLSCASGADALASYGQHGNEVGLVILDLTMPGMSGEQTYDALRALDPDVRVILSSGYSEMDATSRFKGKDLCGFLQKPYRPEELVAKVRSLLSASSRPSSN